MRKAEFKRMEGKNESIQDRLNHKGVYCISNDWIKWAKRYMNRSVRRKERYILDILRRKGCFK